MQERFKRQSFLGVDSEKILQDSTVALVGLGGGGSHLAQQLAHLGVGRFILIDPDRVEESNLNRMVGATAKDATRKTRKTTVAKRVIQNLNSHTTVVPIHKKWQQCHPLLRGCDVILASLDTYQDRQELEITARRYLVPYIDVGMDVHEVNGEFSLSGQVILSMPGELCMRCLGFLRDDLLAREAANYGAAGGRPQVVWANGVLASIAVGVFTQLLTPWHTTKPGAVYVEYDANSKTLTSSNRLLHMAEKTCPHFLGLSDLGDPFWVPERV